MRAIEFLMEETNRPYHGYGGDHLYHYTTVNGAKGILKTMYIKGDDMTQQDATKRQTLDFTVSVTRNWGYAIGKVNSQTQAGVEKSHDVVFILDRKKIENNYKTLGTSHHDDYYSPGGKGYQDFDTDNDRKISGAEVAAVEKKYKSVLTKNKGVDGYNRYRGPEETTLDQYITGADMVLDPPKSNNEKVDSHLHVWAKDENEAGKLYGNFLAMYKRFKFKIYHGGKLPPGINPVKALKHRSKAGGEFEEVIPVPKGVLPLKNILVGIHLNTEAAKADPALVAAEQHF